MHTQGSFYSLFLSVGRNHIILSNMTVYTGCLILSHCLSWVRNQSSVFYFIGCCFPPSPLDMQEALLRCVGVLIKNALTLAHYCLVTVDQVLADLKTPAGKRERARLFNLLLKSFSRMGGSKLALTITRLGVLFNTQLILQSFILAFVLQGWWNLPCGYSLDHLETRADGTCAYSVKLQIHMHRHTVTNGCMHTQNWVQHNIFHSQFPQCQLQGCLRHKASQTTDSPKLFPWTSAFSNQGLAGGPETEKCLKSARDELYGGSSV